MKILGLVLSMVLILTGCNRDRAGDSSDGPDGRDATDASPTATAEAESAGPDAAPAQGPSPAAPPAQAAQGKPLESQAVQPAAAGSYIYDETGTRSFGGCGPDGPPPSPTSLRIDPANGDRQQGIRDRRSADGQGMVVTTILEYRTDGIYLVYLRQEQQTPAGPSVSEFEPTPPVLAMPARPTQGQSWQFSLTSKDEKIQVEASNTIEALDEEVAAGGGTAKGTRVKRTTRATGQSILGPIDITENAVSWVASRLIVKEVSDSSGTVGTCRIQSHIEAVIRSTSPS